MERHIPVLEQEAIDALRLKPSSSVVDATLGSCGHATQILNILDTNGTFVGLDVDERAIESARTVLVNQKAKVHLVCRNFREIDTALKELNINTVDAILADLGWRIEQFQGGGRGLSFREDEPLLMTFGEPSKYLFTAHDIVNGWDESDITNVLKGYGEERYAWKIAKAITKERESSPIETSGQLATIIENSVPGHYKHGKVHPATRTFQALRIAVNDELKALEEFIEKSVEHLSPRGRLAIISFHSIEDRIVKHSFRELMKEEKGTVITKKPIIAKQEDMHVNPRARSAKLRIFEKI